ncbi:NADPH-dependent F420 reductase [Paenarthrobacter nitroguajacolicus]|uniref:NADPH-dependent F420 reductase n=1 Tax=Paenarthrobacter nitroguajacolicus TaxID=211146 RepID=UPI0034382639
MKIGILGAGSIGATLARKLSGAGHDVRVANSRGPETIGPHIVAAGARPVEAKNVATDVDVLITSIPLSRMPEVRELIADLPANAVIVDTSNYYPLRDGRVEALETGKVESVWITEQLGRPVAKAWNAITAGSFEAYGREGGHPDRIAIPVAADRDHDKSVAMALVEETGFDAFDAGSLADSWRQQPGAPAYCTDLSGRKLREALAEAEKDRLPQRRDIVVTALTERFPSYTDVSLHYLVRLNRAIYS